MSLQTNQKKENAPKKNLCRHLVFHILTFDGHRYQPKKYAAKCLNPDCFKTSVISPSKEATIKWLMEDGKKNENERKSLRKV